MRQLHVLRHAKSDWGDPAASDHDRRLNARGRRAGKALAHWISASEVRPALVLCSTARRARETLELIEGALERPQVRYEADLYHASVEGLRRTVATLPETFDEVLVVGHNPGLHELVLDLGEPGPERSRIQAGLPTGALVTIAAPVDDWGELAAGGGAVSRVVLPRQLD